MPGAGSGLNSDNRRRAPADEAGALSVVFSLDSSEFNAALGSMILRLGEFNAALGSMILRLGGLGTLRLPAKPKDVIFICDCPCPCAIPVAVNGATCGDCQDGEHAPEFRPLKMRAERAFE
jgi:hypothetical protein